MYGFSPNVHNQGTFVPGGTLVVFDPFEIVYGEPFEVWTGLSASLFMRLNQPLNAAANYANSAVLTGLKPFLDEALTMPAPNPIFQAASGTQYSVNGVVPEPGSLLFALAGLGALAGMHLRRRS
jgi:hypothetical protein